MYQLVTKDKLVQRKIALRRELLNGEKENTGQQKVQAKSELEIGDPDDAYEQEADAVAKSVVSGDSTSGMKHSASPKLQRKEEEEEHVLMAKSENGGLQGTEQLQQQLSSSKGGGQSLDSTVKSEMEQKMGADLGNVKIHTDQKAHDMAEGINAKAFTHGQDVYFKQGNYDPASSSGKELLAHELAHTQQQKGGVNRKVQRQIDLGIARTAFTTYLSSQPSTFIINALFSQWNSLSPEEKEKKINAGFDQKIAGLKLLEDKEPPSAVKTLSTVLEAATPMPLPSLETMWPIIVNGELGY
ncbi:MAG: eCIS core domain-containing protein, partial [Bacteroidia bacterium]